MPIKGIAQGTTGEASGGQSDHNNSVRDEYVVTVNTQNRFEPGSGWGGALDNGWQNVRRRSQKRKKVSSSTMDDSSFSSLTTDEKLSCIFQNMNRNYDMLYKMKRSQEKYFKDTRELQLNVSGLCEQTEKLQQSVDKQSSMLKILSYRSVDIEARSRRNNLIIWGVTENIRLNCETLVLNFLEDELNIDTTNIVIDRAHRLGAQSSYNRVRTDRKRPIIARFRDYNNTELIMHKAYKLKGTPFAIDRDYPREIADARKELYSSELAKEARSRKQKVRIMYPAKLYIDGRMCIDKFPDWTGAMKENRLRESHFAPVPPVTRTISSVFPTRQNNADQSVYCADTEVESSSESDRDHDNVFTSTQIHPDTRATTAKNVNKHAHFLSSNTNGESRDSEQSESTCSSHEEAGNYNLPSTRLKSTQKAAEAKSNLKKSKTKPKCVAKSKNSKVEKKQSVNTQNTTHVDSGSETINSSGDSQSLEHMTVEQSETAASDNENTHL